jgi:hypothetical protein
MIPKSGYRFSEKIMRKKAVSVPAQPVAVKLLRMGWCGKERG